jgi:uncharacterized protein YlxW (UPF0749 family)
MRDKDKRIVFFTIFLILGIMLAVQFRSTLYQNRQKSASVLNIEYLRDRISEETRIRDELKTRIEENAVKRDEYLKALLENKDNLGLKREWEIIRLKAGLTDVKGPGIILRLDDADARQGVDPSLLIIHDQDIRIILNELKKAGAQAISINGERIVATSELICAGPTILINKNRYPVPYIINAIGDPDLLYDSLARSERLAVMIEDKIRVEIKKSKEVAVPKFSNLDNLENLISGLVVIKE